MDSDYNPSLVIFSLPVTGSLAKSKNSVGWVERCVTGPTLARIKVKPNKISQLWGFGTACHPANSWCAAPQPNL